MHSCVLSYIKHYSIFVVLLTYPELFYQATMKSPVLLFVVCLAILVCYSEEESIDLSDCFVVPGPGECYKENNIRETKYRYSVETTSCVAFLRSPCPNDDNRNVFDDEDSCAKACGHVGTK